MIGVLANTVGIIIGGLIGLFIGKSLQERYEKIVINAVAICVLFIGISGGVSGIVNKDSNPILFIIALVIGGIVGEFLCLEKRLEDFGLHIEAKLPKGEKSFSKGFVSASLLFCVGTMAIVGSIQSGLSDNNQTLFAKTVLDTITAVIFASTLGYGVIFSAISVLIYEGSIFAIAKLMHSNIGTSPLQNNITLEMSTVGGILIAMLGLNMLGITKFKVANYLPAILVPIIYLVVCR